LKTFISKFIATVNLWHRHRIAIRELAALSNETLRDIGLHRSEIGSVVTELPSPAPTRLHAMTRSTAILGSQNAVQRVANDEYFKTVA